MGTSDYLEPLSVIVLLIGGAWLNRNTDDPGSLSRKGSWRNEHLENHYNDRPDSLELGLVDPTDKDVPLEHRSISPSLLVDREEPWRNRELGIWSWKLQVSTPNTAVFRYRLLSRFLYRFPFLVEAWYWVLIYWVSLRVEEDQSIFSWKLTSVDHGRHTSSDELSLQSLSRTTLYKLRGSTLCS
jgi:hypothetical protein